MNEPLTRLRAQIAELGSVVVAFSGGVDSALVLAVAHEQLGRNAIALTGVSPTLPVEEALVAERVCASLGVEHLVLDTHELQTEGYARNDGDRCYFCKSELFGLAERVRLDRGLAHVADGTVLDDLGDDRPGLRAAAEGQVRHPLVEAQMSKADVRAAAKTLGLEVWDKPSFACLGSRFARGTRVTAERVASVAVVESALRELGLRQFRVRWHGVDGDALARIELDPSGIKIVSGPEVRRRITQVAQEAGFRWVTLDLVGYRPPMQAAVAELDRRRALRRSSGESS